MSPKNLSPRIEKPVVLIDLDGVMADFDSGIVPHLEASFPELIGTWKRMNHDIRMDFPEAHSPLIDKMIYHPDFFANLDLVEGALEGWENLQRLGYSPQICSSPLPNHPQSIEAKKSWIRDRLVPKLGHYVLDSAHITLFKHEVPGIALIDDCPAIATASLAKWQHVMFDRPYNQYIDTSLRIKGWYDTDISEILVLAQHSTATDQTHNT